MQWAGQGSANRLALLAALEFVPHDTASSPIRVSEKDSKNNL
jgi:hypothetical protein